MRWITIECSFWYCYPWVVTVRFAISLCEASPKAHYFGLYQWCRDLSPLSKICLGHSEYNQSWNSTWTVPGWVKSDLLILFGHLMVKRRLDRGEAQTVIYCMGLADTRNLTLDTRFSSWERPIKLFLIRSRKLLLEGSIFKLELLCWNTKREII